LGWINPDLINAIIGKSAFNQPVVYAFAIDEYFGKVSTIFTLFVLALLALDCADDNLTPQYAFSQSIPGNNAIGSIGAAHFRRINAIETKLLIAPPGVKTQIDIGCYGVAVIDFGDVRLIGIKTAALARAMVAICSRLAPSNNRPISSLCAA